MDQGARAFLRTGTSDEVVHQLSSYIGAGLVYTGALGGRNQDQLGMAVAMAFNGQRFRAMRRQEGTVVDGSEVALELTYLAILPFGLSLQPDLQFIINPGTERSRSNALVLGIRTGMAF